MCLYYEDHNYTTVRMFHYPNNLHGLLYANLTLNLCTLGHQRKRKFERIEKQT